MDRITHVVHGQEYEIRTTHSQREICVGIFKSGQRLGPRYLISFETTSDFKHYTGDNAISQLIALAKADLDSGLVK